MADAALGRAVRYRSLDADERARIKATLNDFVTIANPLDYHTFIWAKEEAMTETFSAMIGCGFDLSMLVLDFPRDDRCSDADWEVSVRAIIKAAERTGGRTAVVATLPENMPEARAEAFLAAGIAPLCGVEEAIAAAEAAAFIGARWKETLPRPVLNACRSWPDSETDAGVTSPLEEGVSRMAAQASFSPRTGEAESRQRPGEGNEPRATRQQPSRGSGLCLDSASPVPGEEGVRRAMTLPSGEPWADGNPKVGLSAELATHTCFEVQAKAALAAFGLAVLAGRVVSTSEEAVAAGEALGYPVVLKAIGVAHKSEAGAVRLNLRNAAEVESAAARLAGLGAGLLIETMVTDAVAELLIGVTRDPQFGLLMTIGAGGVLVELLSDARSLLLPATEDDIRSAILSLRTAPLLQGFRGRPRGDLEAAIAAVLSVARFAEAHTGTLEELDVNPLLVRPEGQGAVAVDALIRLRSLS